MIALFPNVRSFEFSSGILHVGPTKSLTFSPGDLRVAMFELPLFVFLIRYSGFQEDGIDGIWGSRCLVVYFLLQKR